MTFLGAAAQRWNALWFSPVSAYPIAAFRILLGLFLLIYFGTLAPHVTTLFSSEGVYAPYFVPDYAPAPVVACLLFAALWLAALGLLLGVRASVTIPCLLLLYFYHYFLALAVKHSSFERLIAIYLLVLWPSRCDSVWALSTPADQNPKPAASSFAGRLIRFQTILLYLGAGLWKAANPAWRSGVLLAATLQGIWATPLAFWLMERGASAQTWLLLSRAVIAGEVLLAGLFFFTRTRPLAIVLGVLFHVINCVILSIPEFLVCITPYVFFVPEAAFERLAARIERFKTRNRANA
jgi:hypothetical protein